VATGERTLLRACDGFRAEAPHGLLGWVEETWLGPDESPAAVALRLVDGRRGLLLADDVEIVVPESRELVVRDGASMLELAAPRLEQLGRDGVVAAHWETTGEVLEPPPAPGLVARALLAARPWRLAPPPEHPGERSVGQALAIMLPLLAVLIAAEIALAFLVADLVTGHAY
jgi:hypothetical protein